MDLLDNLLSEDTLAQAWARVRSNDGCAGVDGIDMDEFGRNALIRIGRLRDQVRDGRYQPTPLRRVALPRPGREPRLLAIPCIGDRVLQTAAGLVLGPLLDPHFEDESYAYRPGRSVRDAISRVADLRDAGLAYVVDADIRAFFDQTVMTRRDASEHETHDRFPLPRPFSRRGEKGDSRVADATFTATPHRQLIARLAALLPDASLLPLIRQWLATPIQTADECLRPSAGVAQGSPLSPLLANLYLDGFDEAISAVAGRHLVRYGDDFVIVCGDSETAERALEDAAQWLHAAGLEINYDKTRIVLFSQGLHFLGVRFDDQGQRADDPAAEVWLLPRRLRPARSAVTAPPPVLPARPKPPAPAAKHVATTVASQAAAKTAAGSTRAQPRVSHDDAPPPLLRTLYLAEPGAYLHLDGGRIVVEKKGEELLSVPLEKVDQVLVADEGAVSFAVLRTLVARGAGLLVQGKAGAPLAMLVNANDSRVELRRSQYQRSADADFCLAAAKAIVAGKIANSRLLLRRHYRFQPGAQSPADSALRELQAHAQQAKALEELRGVEGAAARAYFEAFAGLLPARWSFPGRRRQPPSDPVNALLSYGYAVLFQNLLTLVCERGLDPHLACLHALRDGHPALGRRAERVQESVFEGWLSGAEIRVLLDEVAALIEPSVDAVRAYPLALREASRRESLGEQPGATRPLGYWIT